MPCLVCACGLDKRVLHLLLLAGLNARRVLEKLRVDLAGRQENVANDRAADEAVLHAHLRTKHKHIMKAS